MLTERITLTTLLFTSALAGLSFATFERQRLARRFARHGLHPYRASLPGGEVHYWAGGNPAGRPLLLIHGFGGDALFGWAGQAPLARDRFLVAPDLLWFGDSHGTVDDYSARHQADVLAALLDHLALDRVDACGISYGGFVLLELVQHHLARVGRAIFVDSPAHAFTLDDYHDTLDRLGLDSITSLITPDGPEGVQALLRLAYYRPPPVPRMVARDVYDRLFVKWRQQKVRLLDHLLRLAGEVDPSDYRVPVPSLVLWGDHDVLFPPELAYRLAATIGPHARVTLIPRANHAPNLERPLFFNRAVNRFLASEAG